MVRFLLFDNLHMSTRTQSVQHDCANYFMAKLLRANGGCLGVKRR